MKIHEYECEVADFIFTYKIGIDGCLYYKHKSPDDKYWFKSALNYPLSVYSEKNYEQISNTILAEYFDYVLSTIL